MIRTEKKTYEQGIEDGRKIEAHVTLENLYIILDSMSTQVHETDHIMSCIEDLEKYLGCSR